VPGINLIDTLRFLLLFHPAPRLVVFHVGGKVPLDKSQSLLDMIQRSRVPRTGIYYGIGTQTLESTAIDASGEYLGDSLLIHLSKSKGMLGVGHRATVENFPAGIGAGLHKMEDGSVAVMYGSAIYSLQPGAEHAAVEDFRAQFPDAAGEEAFYSQEPNVIKNFTLYNTIFHGFTSRGQNSFQSLLAGVNRAGATVKDARKFLAGLLDEIRKTADGQAFFAAESGVTCDESRPGSVGEARRRHEEAHKLM
jgi:hypothetical protein